MGNGKIGNKIRRKTVKNWVGQRTGYFNGGRRIVGEKERT